MPSSDHRQIPIIIDILKEVSPKTILDIGCGCGKYGLLAKEYLRDKPYIAEWKKVERVDGIEVFDKYITDIQLAIYDTLYIGDATKIKIGDYDLYMLIDSIEHIPKDKGLELVSRLKKKGKVLIATPMRFEVHPPRYGNSHEEHISHYTYEDFGGKNYSNTNSLIVLI
jgi:2-polyprenyl-3-methyl-5-hydroxy-6-metoxy-1,4-benzoquinol methylase